MASLTPRARGAPLDAYDVVTLIPDHQASVNARGTGSAQYPPSAMLALLLYCYSQGIYSSRKIERATYTHIGVRYLLANHHPDHDTIARCQRSVKTRQGGSNENQPL